MSENEEIIDKPILGDDNREIEEGGDEETPSIEEQKKAINLPDLRYVKRYIDSTLEKNVKGKYYKKTDIVDEAAHASNADNATEAEHAASATRADIATLADSSTEAEHAASATRADSAVEATLVERAIGTAYPYDDGSFGKVLIEENDGVLKVKNPVVTGATDEIISKKRLIWSPDGTGSNSVKITSPTGLINIGPYQLQNVTLKDYDKLIVEGYCDVLDEDGITPLISRHFETPPFYLTLNTLMGETVFPLAIKYTVNGETHYDWRFVQIAAKYIKETHNISFTALIDSMGNGEDSEFNYIRFGLSAVYKIIE